MMLPILLIITVTASFLIFGLILIIGSKKRWKVLFDEPSKWEKKYLPYGPELLRKWFGEKTLYYYDMFIGVVFTPGSIWLFVYMVFIV
jgi:hypothetical protein